MDRDYFRKSYKRELYVDILRDYFRNGLSHGFTVKDGGVETEGSYLEIKSYGPEINPVNLFIDFKQAFDKYISDLRKEGKNSQIGNDFKKVFEEIYL